MRVTGLPAPAQGPGEQGRPAGSAAGRPGWGWALLWLGLTVGLGLLVRLPGPATLDPDEHAAVLYLDRLVAGERLEEPLLSAPKPLLTVVHGLAWRIAHDWRVLEAVAVAAFALAVVCLARAAGRLAGPPAAAATVVALAGSGPLVLQAARGNSSVFALAGWSVALDALTRDDRRPASGAAWGVAAGALAVAALARAEGWLLLPLAAGYGLVAWRRGARRAWLLALPLAVPLLWLAHDWLLTGDPLYAVRVPGRYTELVSGPQVVPPANWLALVGRRYAADPLLLGLAAVGTLWLASRRAWIWLAGLGALGFGVLALLGLEAWRGTYISWRYFDPPDVAVRLTAALGAASLATALAARLPAFGAAVAARLVGAGATRVSGGGGGSGADRLVGAGGVVVVAVLLTGLACWPLAPADPQVGSTLDRGARLSANAAAAVPVLRRVVAEPETVVTVSGPQRQRVAVELELPLGRVRDLFLAGRAAPLEQALAGSAAVFHDADGDRPTGRFAPLSTTTPARVGRVALTPLHTDPEQGLYVHRVEERGD